MAQFDWLPYFQGKYLTYYQIMSLIFSVLCLILSLISFTIYLILQKYRLFPKYAQFCYKFVFYCLSCLPLVCMAADLCGFWEGVVGMAVVLGIGEIMENGVISNQSRSVNMGIMSRGRDRKIMFNNNVWRKIGKILLISLLCNTFFYKTCISFYNNEIGIQSKLFGVTINTYFMRMIQLKTSCPPGPPCQLYTTIPEDPHQAFFLNIHTHTSVQKVTVFYQQLLSQNTKNNKYKYQNEDQDQDEQSTFLNVTAQCYHYKGLQWRTARNVHTALIMGLKPNTKYLLKVFYDGKYWTNAIYKTLPNDPSHKIRMINGGDSGYCPGAVKLSKIVATLNPDIFFMGGDIAYDNNIPACSYTWDYFLNMYGQITTTLGYLMPIVTSVGNHDTGINQLPGINITVNAYGPAFLIYFPQHYDRNNKFQIVKQVPPIQHRRTMTGFTFANVHFLVLDSGYLHGFDGWQKQYMIKSFQQNKNKIKFVNYHVPIYGSCQAFDKNPQRFLYALFHWVPLFDKYKVMTVFQNHVHAFKRTKPLIASSPVTSGGTVYLGDGSYGAFNQLACHPDASIGIFQKFNSNNNFWMTDVYAEKVVHTCYNSQGKIIDEFTQNISQYKLTGQEKEINHNSVQDLLPKKDIFAKTLIQ